MSTDFEEWINRQYIKPKGKMTAMSELHQVFLSMVPKEENRGGESWTTPAYISTPRGHARTRSEAQSIAQSSGGGGSYGTWTSTPGNATSSVEFSNREVAASQGMSDSGFVAFAEAQKHKIEGLTEGFGSKMSRMILGPPGSFLFQAATISNGVITLNSDYADVIGLIEPGDQLQLSDEDGDEDNDALIGSGNIGYVIAVDPEGDSPTVTVATSPGGSAASPSDWEANATGFIYKLGEFKGGIDRGPNATNSQLVIDSVQAWLPPTTLTDTFKGVDRSVTSKLTGLRQTSTDITSLDIEECLEQMFVRGRQRYGWKGGQKIFVNSVRFNQLSRSLETRRMRGMSEMKWERGGGESGNKAYASFGYNKIALYATNGSFEVIDEPHMPADYALATDPSKWRVRSYEGFPQAVDKDSNRILRKSTDDDYEFRLAAYASFMLAADGVISHSGRTALPTAA